MSLLKSGEQLGILAELFDSGGAPAQFDTSEEVSTWTNSNTDAADLIEDPAFPGDFNHRILRFKALGSGSVTLKGDGQQGTGITDVMGSIDYQCVGNDVAIVKLTAGDPTPIPAP
jgi:hypothetical protein